MLVNRFRKGKIFCRQAAGGKHFSHKTLHLRRLKRTTP
jgi:hypothetical protein